MNNKNYFLLNNCKKIKKKNIENKTYLYFHNCRFTNFKINNKIYFNILWIYNNKLYYKFKFKSKINKILIFISNYSRYILLSKNQLIFI